MTEVGSTHEQMYTEIAADDLADSAQPLKAKLDRARFDIAKLQRFLPADKRARILEIGPGNGVLSRELAKDHDLFVMDITDEYIHRFDFVTGAFIADIESMPFVDEFDVIILCDVLEHVLHEGDALLAIQQSLRIGGVAYIRCPSNEPSFSYARRLGSIYPYVHLRNYTVRTLTWATVHAGLAVRRRGNVRLVPTGYARRDFGSTRLREARAHRFTMDIQRAHHGLPGVLPSSRLDWFVDLLEVYYWKIGRRMSGRLSNYVLQRIWYRPAEVYLIGQKQRSNFLQPTSEGS